MNITQEGGGIKGFQHSQLSLDFLEDNSEKIKRKFKIISREVKFLKSRGAIQEYGYYEGLMSGIRPFLDDPSNDIPKNDADVHLTPESVLDTLNLISTIIKSLLKDNFLTDMENLYIKSIVRILDLLKNKTKLRI